MHTQDAPTLRRSKNRNGRPIPGLWESDVVRMERASTGWAAQVPMRPIGQSVYWEFRAASRGGAWVDIGRYHKRADAVRAALLLKSGLYVWRAAHTTDSGLVPGVFHRWEDVSAEIAAHPSVNGMQGATPGGPAS